MVARMTQNMEFTLLRLSSYADLSLSQYFQDGKKSETNQEGSEVLCQLDGHTIMEIRALFQRKYLYWQDIFVKFIYVWCFTISYEI
jgi:uncharacterized membrane protein